MTKDELIKFYNDHNFIVKRCDYIIHKLEGASNHLTYREFSINLQYENINIYYYNWCKNTLYYLQISFDTFLGNIDSFIEDYKNKYESK